MRFTDTLDAEPPTDPRPWAVLLCQEREAPHPSAGWVAAAPQVAIPREGARGLRSTRRLSHRRPPRGASRRSRLKRPPAVDPPVPRAVPRRWRQIRVRTIGIRLGAAPVLSASRVSPLTAPQGWQQNRPRKPIRERFYCVAGQPGSARTAAERSVRVPLWGITPRPWAGSQRVGALGCPARPRGRSPRATRSDRSSPAS